MRPTCGVHDLRAAHMLVSAVAVALQNTFELAEKLPGAFSAASQLEVEHHASSGRAVLPQISLMVLPALIMHLHIHRSLIRLDVSSMDYLAARYCHNRNE